MRGRAVLLLAAAAASLAGCAHPEPAVLTRSLDRGWQLQEAGDSTWIPATVPGTVHTDLLAAGRIPDPFVGDREKQLAWIEDADWTYRTRIHADARLLARQHVELVFDGLDTYADVLVNGTKVLAADNMFRQWRVDVKRVLHEGENTLEVRFASPIRVGREKAAESPWPIPHQEPDPSNTRAFTRKAAYQYGWDWGPRYVTSGIWMPARLEAWSGSRIRSVRVVTDSLGAHQARVRVDVEVRSTRAGRVRVGVKSADGAFTPEMVDADVRAGVDTVALTLRIAEPKLWWPRDFGEAHLYGVDVDLTRDGRWDHRHVRFGVRTIALDTTGGAFTFVVNDVPFFARGANLVPPDHFLPRVDSARWARVLGDAASANMNMVRVWGGGAYLPDVFYDLADADGVLVWQDFMFANAMVPGDSAFDTSVAAEARYQVRRLRNHPSLALWCGNNEIAEAWGAWGWQDDYAPDVRAEVAAAYARIFEGVLPEAVRTNDPSVPYWPASPPVSWARPEALVRGDSHYWGVWHGRQPFRAYAEHVPRFASEFGFQALPAEATLEAFDSVAPKSLDDAGMQEHQKFLTTGNFTGYDMMRLYMRREGWPVPPDDSVDAFAYVSQLQQAEGVGLAMKAERRSWPRTAGSLFWQLDDSWPVVSWSSVDYFGRWKALQYEARRVFAPVVVLADLWRDTLRVWAMTDTGRVRAALQVRTVDVGRGTARVRETRTATLQGGSAPQSWAWPVDSVLGGADARRTVVEVSLLKADGTSLSRDLAFAVPPDSLRLPDPGVRIESVERDGDAWKVTLTAARFAYGVRLTVAGEGARFSDDWFDLLPGETRTVLVTPDRATPDLAGRLRVRTLAGVGAEGSPAQ
jgi:beta-mannosidase